MNDVVTAELFHIEAEGKLLYLLILSEHDITEGLICSFHFSGVPCKTKGLTLPPILLELDITECLIGLFSLFSGIDSMRMVSLCLILQCGL